ncbi:MAG: conjugative transposon protein TraM [Dysgonamonadaceae bacterium]|jgi:conjugative transposon TraM protein|nr:conjugative transposon protein TraM [Dysgonamonadaceae bacterium]
MSTNNQGMSEVRKQAIKKYAVFALMAIICAGCMWFIFAPSADEKAKQDAQAGFNTDVPLPKDAELIIDKRDAYEQEQMKQKQEERMRSLQDFSSLMGDSNTQKPDDDLSLLDEPEKAKTTGGGSGGTGRQNSPQSSIQNSARAYQDVSRTLGSFYDSPKNDPEKEKLQMELEELRRRMDEKENTQTAVDEQMAIMERSYQMASRYLPLNPGTTATAMPGMPGTGTGMPGTGTANAEPQSSQPQPANASRKLAIIPVSQVKAQTVSVLRPELSSAEIMEAFEKPRNMGFLTVTAEPAGVGMKNTIIACVHDNQTIRDGQSVQIRLLEPMQVGTTVIPQNTVLSGMAKIQGERLGITVRSLEYKGTIVPVELTVYDNDGQQGVFIPNLQDLNAAKEVLANMGTSAGTSINLSGDAGKQFVADMGRNVVQGVSQFTSKKLREVKIRLKAGYRIFLISEEQLKK